MWVVIIFTNTCYPQPLLLVVVGHLQAAEKKLMDADRVTLDDHRARSRHQEIIKGQQSIISTLQRPPATVTEQKRKRPTGEDAVTQVLTAVSTCKTLDDFLALSFVSLEVSYQLWTMVFNLKSKY